MGSHRVGHDWRDLAGAAEVHNKYIKNKGPKEDSLTQFIKFAMLLTQVVFIKLKISLLTIQKSKLCS